MCGIRCFCQLNTTVCTRRGSIACPNFTKPTNGFFLFAFVFETCFRQIWYICISDIYKSNMHRRKFSPNRFFLAYKFQKPLWSMKSQTSLPEWLFGSCSGTQLQHLCRGPWQCRLAPSPRLRFTTQKLPVPFAFCIFFSPQSLVGLFWRLVKAGKFLKIAFAFFYPVFLVPQVSFPPQSLSPHFSESWVFYFFCWPKRGSAVSK